MKKYIIGFVTIASLMFCEMSKAQIKYNTWTLGFQFGNIYDLPTNLVGRPGDGDPVSFGSSKTQFDYTIGGYLEKQMSPIIALHLSFDYAHISGSASVDYYSSVFRRYNLSLLISLTNIATKKPDPYLNVYGLVGVGYVNYHAQRYLLADDEPNRNGVRDGGASQINAGFGVRKHLTEQIRIELESTYNMVFDNGFDGDAFNFKNGEDEYLRTVIGIAYTFGNENNRSLHKTPLFASDYLWNDDEIKKRIKLDDDYLADKIDENIADEKAQIANNTNRINKLEGDVTKLGDKLDTFINGFNGEIIHTRNVYYATDKHNVTKEYQKFIQEIVTILNSNDSYLVDVTGVTDIYASESYNAKLRVRRAEGVKNFMVKKFNISPDRITTNTQKEKISGVPYQHLNRKTQIVIYRNN